MALLLTPSGTGSAAHRLLKPKTILVVVTVRWKPSTTTQQKHRILDGVATMGQEIHGIQRVWIDSPKVQPPGFETAFALEFTDRAALNAFATDPVHKRWDEIFVPQFETVYAQEITN
ncbi:Dabb family protein [Occallatibacter savannae]|uniref:Dabb family protein n=1 Tax=Occallatibacter savannae TaxID=1002691 RepID=UPI0013A59CE4|nr:Dabb family protein [Occallatibacter savannae]